MDPKKKPDIKQQRRTSALPSPSVCRISPQDKKKLAEITTQKVFLRLMNSERISHITDETSEYKEPKSGKSSIQHQSGSSKNLNPPGTPLPGLGQSASVSSLKRYSQNPAVSSPGNVKVICRFRPMNSREKDHPGQFEMVQFPPDKKTVVYKKSQQLEQGSHKFTFDQTFEMDSLQNEVFESVKDIIGGLFEGFNGTIFAYGQTGSGKTHTMMGPDELTPETQGLIPRITEMIFQVISAAPEHIEFMIRVSMVEIYMEKIKDLLNPTKDNLKIHEDKEKGVYINDCTEIYVSDESDVQTIMMRGNENRAVSATNMNERSSRSHTIFIITIKQTNRQDSTCKSGKLYLVDLAGSEKLSKTGAKGHVFEEAITINKSLTTLGIVINKLTDGVSKYVPYRDSKLTRVLQESLGGNAKTCLIITCSPSSFNAPETLSTLRFGERAKSIKNKPKVNKEFTVGELKKLLEKAEQRIEGLIKKNLVLEKAIQEMGGDLQALYGNADQMLLNQDDQDDIDYQQILDVTSPDVMADLSTILDDPFADPTDNMTDDGIVEDFYPQTFQMMEEQDRNKIIQRKWKLQHTEIREVDQGGDSDDCEQSKIGMIFRDQLSPVVDAADESENEENIDALPEQNLNERIKIWEMKCQKFQKELQVAKIEKQKEVSKLMGRISKERERNAKYRKKLGEVSKEASKKSATLLLVSAENQNLIKKIAGLKLQSEQHEKFIQNKESRMKQLLQANTTLVSQNKLLKQGISSDSFALSPSKMHSPASPSSAGPAKLPDSDLLKLLQSVVQESLIPKHHEADLKNALGQDIEIRILNQQALTEDNDKAKHERRIRQKEKQTYLGKIKRRQDKIKNLEREASKLKMQIYELKGAVQRNGNPLQDKLSTLEKNLEHLTMLYYQLVSQKSTLQLEKNILEKKLKRHQKLLQDKNSEYRQAKELAQYRKGKLEKLLRKLNRGLQDHESYMKSIEDHQRQSVIGDDVLRTGKIAKPIKGGGQSTTARYPRSNSEYISSTLLQKSELKIGKKEKSEKL